MQSFFDIVSQVFKEGLLPNMTDLVEFLLSDGIALGAVVILLPLLGRLIRFFKHLF